MPDTVSCRQYQNFLVSQEPVYDEQILEDIRPFDGLIGYYETESWKAYSAAEHTFDRFNSTFPNVTKGWTQVVGGNCVGTPCDPTENKIGWGYTRGTYNLEKQSWGSEIICFDDVMLKTRAKAHFRQIIDKVLRPATNWIITYFLQRRLLDIASKVLSVTTGLPAMTFTWEADATDPTNAYVYLNTSSTPTGRLTPSILKSQVTRQYFLGAVAAGKEGYDKLELQTDKDTLSYLQKQDPTLLDAWRFGDFGPAAKEFYRYGFSGWVGDFMVKVLQFPLRFNKVAANRFQLILPYVNVATTEGIKSTFNEDYDNAQYQFSQINNRRAILVRPYQGEPVNPMMPFATRDFGGKWKFGTNDLGADCNGGPIDNVRGNKGKFYADFELALKPMQPDWIVGFFHMVERPCITIIGVCNADPGYPEQSYDSANAVCPRVQTFTVAAASNGHYKVAANTIACDGNTITQAAIDETTLAALVVTLNARFVTAGLTGTWAVDTTTALTIKLTASECDNVTLPFTLG